MSFKPSSAIIAALLVAAGPGLVQAAEPAPKAAEASASASAVAPAPPGKGQVVFFRKSSMLGFPYWTNVRENDVALGKLTNGVYFAQTLEPGVHLFNTSVLGKDAMKLQVDPGETYYVEGKITMAVVGYTIVMAPSDEAAFQKAFKGMKLGKPEAAHSEPAAN